jgi:hypothetical protein
VKVLQSGRLGNFLFQWAFANHLALTHDLRVQIIFDRFHSDISQLKDLQETFNSKRIDLDKSNLYGFGFKALDFLASKTPRTSSALQRMLNVYTEGEYETKDNFQIYRGFFQESKFAMALNESDLEKLSNKVDNEKQGFEARNPDFFKNRHYQVVHLRLGDFKKSSFGVLKLDSMLKILPPDVPTVICTDGFKDELIARIGNNKYEVLTPSESNAWETLSVIRNAQRVISSNSTMSWWGAFLAKQQGAEVFLPSQWWKDDKNTGRMYFPGAKLFISEFE